MCGRTCCTLHPRRLRRIANLTVLPSDSSASSHGVCIRTDSPKDSSKTEAAEASLSILAAPTSEEEPRKTPVPSDADTALLSVHKFNLSPTGTIPLIVQDPEGHRYLRPAEWSLRIPGVSGGPGGGGRHGYSTFNARVEGVAESKLYKRLLNKGRCVVVVDGFYEWSKTVKRADGKKQPYFIRYRPSVLEKPIPLNPKDVKEAEKNELKKEERPDPPVKRERDEQEAHDARVRKKAKTQEAEETPSSALASEQVKSEQKEHSSSTVLGNWTSALGDNEAPMLLAGLYEDEAVGGLKTSKAEAGFYADCSATILTMESKGTPMEKIHTRMPVVLSPEDGAQWLDASHVEFRSLIGKVLSGCRHIYSHSLTFFPVTVRMSNSRYEAPDCVVEVSEEADGSTAGPSKKPKLMKTLDHFMALKPSHKGKTKS